MPTDTLLRQSFYKCAKLNLFSTNGCKDESNEPLYNFFRFLNLQNISLQLRSLTVVLSD